MKERWRVLRCPRLTVEQVYSADIAAKLRKIYQEIEPLPPEKIRGKCKSIVGDINEQVGFESVPGRFRLDKSYKYSTSLFQSSPLLHGHWWNIDNEGRIVDLTARQFNPFLKHWHHVPQGILIIDSKDRLRKRYLPNRD